MAINFKQWLATASKTTLALGSIFIGIVFIILSDPPRTLCDTQIDFFKSQQSGILFKSTDAKEKTAKVPLNKMMGYCKAGNGPGACYETFATIKKVLSNLKDIPLECSEQVANVEEITKMLWSTVDFMVTTSWGSKPPDSYLERAGWFDTADLALFCQLKEQITNILGQSKWDVFQERLLQSLPEANTLKRNVVWQKSILSEDCRKY